MSLKLSGFLIFLCACSSAPSKSNVSESVKEVSISKGEQLFNKYCTSCHFSDDRNMIGPGLKNIQDRLPVPADKYFKKYVQNNEAVYQSGDAYAIKVRNDFNGLLMPAFDHVLNEEQVMEIYTFLNKK